ncbi:MAG: hypothetical protein ACI8Y7_000546 [Candidatus Woesearchaeota archaeon]|jgi:hypothetical protein
MASRRFPNYEGGKVAVDNEGNSQGVVPFDSLKMLAINTGTICNPAF